MATNYMTLKSVTASLEKRFIVLLNGYCPTYTRGRTVQMGLNGDPLITRAAKSLRILVGRLRVSDNLGSEYGTMADLRALYESADLQVKGPEDSAYWNCEWIGDIEPSLLDPYGHHQYVSFQLLERTAS